MALSGYDNKDPKYSEINQTSTVSGIVSERPNYITSSYAQPLHSEGVNQMATQYVRTFTDKKNVVEYSSMRDRNVGVQQTIGYQERPKFNVYPDSRKESNVLNQFIDRNDYMKCDPSNAACTQSYTDRMLPTNL